MKIWEWDGIKLGDDDMMNDEWWMKGDLWVKQALTQNPSPTQNAIRNVPCTLYNTPMYRIEFAKIRQTEPEAAIVCTYVCMYVCTLYMLTASMYVHII
jgi:hypothetical protein